VVRRFQGYTLVELVVSVSTALILFAVTHALLQSSQKTWNRVSGDENVAGQLLSAESWLRRDLFGASYSALRTAPGPTTLVGRDGDALWFLSAIDPDTGRFMRNDDGTPRWQRNILYYSVIPSSIATDHSGPGIDEGGYEVSHPYKFLVRKVIDQGTLLSDVTSYLEAPVGYSFPSGDFESVNIISRGLLSFQVATEDDLKQVELSIVAANAQEAGKVFPLGSRSLMNPQFLMLRQFTTNLQNRQTLTP